jgi:hypothetical protein
VESAPDDLGRSAVTQLVRRITRSPDAGPPVVRFVPPVLSDKGSTDLPRR